MNSKMPKPAAIDVTTCENIAYIKEILGELRQVAAAERCEMLCYLLEMAYVEAHDILNGHRPLRAG